MSGAAKADFYDMGGLGMRGTMGMCAIWILRETPAGGDLATLLIILGLLAGGIVASLIADRRDPPTPVEEERRRPPRCPERLAPPEPATGSRG